MSAGPEPDAATCHDCGWNASGPWSHDVAEQHAVDTGHRTALYAAPKPTEPPLFVTNKGTRDIWHPPATAERGEG